MNVDYALILSNKNHCDNFEYFAYNLGLAVEKTGEIPFQKAWNNHVLDVIFSEQGTLVCAPVRAYNVAAASQASEVAVVALSKDTGKFNLECAENGSMKRIYTEEKGVVKRNVKMPLVWEGGKAGHLDILEEGVWQLTGEEWANYQNKIAVRYSIIK